MIRLCAVLALLPGAGSADSLTIGTGGHYAPYYLVQDGQISGLDVDLITAFCQSGGHECTWVDMALPDLLPALVAGQIDIVAGGIGITDERETIVDFTCPYYALDGADGELHSLSADFDPATGRVAVSQGSIYERAARKAGFTVDLYPTDLAAAQAMLIGASGGFMGSPRAFEGQPGSEAVKYIRTLPTETSGPAFAVSEAAPGLLADLNDFLADHSASGHLSALQVQWLGLDQGDVIARCNTYDALT